MNVNKNELRFSAYDTIILRALPKNTTHKLHIRFDHVNRLQDLRKGPKA